MRNTSTSGRLSANFGEKLPALATVNSTADSDIRLQDMHSALNQCFESPTRHLALAGGDRDGRCRAELAVAFQIVLRERLFKPSNFELL